LSQGAARLDAVFTAALTSRDAPGAVAAILELDALILEWSADNAATDAPDRARGVLRSMIVRLGEVAVDGAREPRDVLAPVVEVAIAARRHAREHKDWSASDSIRDGLATAGVEVRDTPDGMVWDLRQGSGSER
jgi:cysteinyl-tRNA synthetase